MREEANDLNALVEELVGAAPPSEPERPRWTPDPHQQQAAIVELMAWVRREVLGEAA